MLVWLSHNTCNKTEKDGISILEIIYKASEAEVELLKAGYHRRSSEASIFSYGKSEDVETCLKDGEVHLSWHVDNPEYTKVIEFDTLQGSVGFWSARSVSWMSWSELKAITDRAKELGFNV